VSLLSPLPQVATLEGEDATNGELYIKMAEKGIEKGSSWLAKERTRLEKMLGTGHLSAAKSEEMSKKASVLSAFLDEPSTS
jgi:protein disulfide-isomerase A6